LIAINPQVLEGVWRSGIALDFHTTSSTPSGYNEYGHMQFETVRPPIAELLYQLKYRRDAGAAGGIVEAAASFLAPHLDKLDFIVPVPPSTMRNPPPVMTIARGINHSTGLPLLECITLTRPATELKSVTDPDRRKELLNGLYAVNSGQTKGKRVLLFDDVFRSGSTMSAITETLMRDARAASVSILTVTKTRNNR